MPPPSNASDPTPRIRRLTAADVDDYRTIRLATLRIEPEFFGTLHAEESARPLQSFADAIHRAAIFGAYVDGQIAGTIRLQPGSAAKERHKGSIHGVFVMPERRGRGLGHLLMTTVIDAARPSLENLTLSVVASNKPAIALYERLGFRRYGTEPRARKFDGVYTDLVLMALPLVDG